MKGKDADLSWTFMVFNLSRSTLNSACNLWFNHIRITLAKLCQTLQYRVAYDYTAKKEKERKKEIEHSGPVSKCYLFPDMNINMAYSILISQSLHHSSSRILSANLLCQGHSETFIFISTEHFKDCSQQAFDWEPSLIWNRTSDNVKVWIMFRHRHRHGNRVIFTQRLFRHLAEEDKLCKRDGSYLMKTCFFFVPVWLLNICWCNTSLMQAA